ncbi:MAG: hypothetical protein A3G88_03965 [Omnitrophica WOR_2 bacterium RIFCSPLOWO2_12_FULL_63_16]|nr:MAG: hypothetical protein A3G88_03965 [Omnitrophica WOR_2 bacterium RIFCSPLOWO2_12_FULL_63_16]
MIPRILRRVGLTLLVLCGLVRFVGSGLLPATQALRGDFGAVFPAPALAASLRPDFPINQFWAVWHGDTVWYYGPMFHVLTLPLFLAPSWNMVPPLWALVNLIAVVAAFAFCWRLAAPASSTARGEHLALLAGLWLLYQPLVNCFAQGNIELIELAVILGAIGLAHRGRLVSAGVVLGIGTMTKLLPVGFLVWLGVRGSRRALMAGGITIALIAALTAVTLGWEHSAEVDRFLERFRIVGIKGTMLSFPALVASWLGTVGWTPPYPVLPLSPHHRAIALFVGRVVTATLAVAYAALILRRRRIPAPSLDVSLLFLLMFLLLPYQEDYYYLFALVPLSVLVGIAIASGSRRLLGVVLLAYVLISPPIPYSWVDRLGWFPGPFIYITKFYSTPLLGALLLLATVTRCWLRDSASGRR